MDYVILKSKDSSELSNRITEELNYGWTLQGELQIKDVIIQDPQHGTSLRGKKVETFFIQSMIKKN